MSICWLGHAHSSVSNGEPFLSSSNFWKPQASLSVLKLGSCPCLHLCLSFFLLSLCLPSESVFLHGSLLSRSVYFPIKTLTVVEYPHLHWVGYCLMSTPSAKTLICRYAHFHGCLDDCDRAIGETWFAGVRKWQPWWVFLHSDGILISWPQGHSVLLLNVLQIHPWLHSPSRPPSFAMPPIQVTVPPKNG